MKITENFEYIGTQQNFERDSYATLAEMKAVVDKRMPDIFTATCKETGKLYIYNNSNEVDETLGKWREIGLDSDDYVTKTYLDTELANKSNIDHTHTTVNGHTVESDVPADAKFTDTVYDDTEVKAEIAKKADITSIPSKVSELTNDSNYQTAEQVSSTVTTEIAKVVADAPESLNTLKEMSDWIAGHEDNASAMNSAISDNKTAITALQTGKANKSEIPTTVAQLTDSADYAKKTDIPTTLPANGGNANTVNNHTVKSDVPENAVFTDTVYDDTEVKGSITEINSNLTENNVTLAVAGNTYITSYSAWNVGKEVFFNFDLKVNEILNANTWYDIGNLSISPNQNFYYTCIYNYNQIGTIQITKDGLLKLYIGDVIYQSNTPIRTGGVYHI